jgi:pimeloyl-ACP methyl ester carboxylesterase
MTLPSLATTRSVTVLGARLHYEVRGGADVAARRGADVAARRRADVAARRGADVAARRGAPLVLVIGSPMASAEFAGLADALAGDYTVVTYDPRGHADSTIDDPQEESTPESRADDIAAILDDLGAESADVFGSSGGAVTGLALVARHPGRVRTLVAHEPPLLELLPDAARHRANTEAIIETFRTEGLHSAWYQFMVTAGFDMSGPGEGAPVVAPPEPTEQEIREAARFFEHELRPTTRYLPDVDVLKNSPSRVVIGIGADSGPLLTYGTSVALGGLLGSTPVEFPGDHGGFLGAPLEFADTLRTVLS